MKYRLRAVYTGRRMQHHGKAWQRFEMPDGSERFFVGIRGVSMGYTYQIGAKNIATRPERIRDVEWVSNPKWEAADALTEAKLAARRAEQKAHRLSKPALKAALIALEPLCKGLDFFQRRALIELLANKTNKGKL